MFLSNGNVSSPSMFRRSSSSSSLLASASAPEISAPEIEGHVGTNGVAQFTQSNGYSLPSYYSPTHSSNSSMSASQSLDTLKSSLRGTLANCEDRRSLNGDIKERPKRRSVSFALDEAQAVSAAIAQSAPSPEIPSSSDMMDEPFKNASTPPKVSDEASAKLEDISNAHVPISLASPATPLSQTRAVQPSEDWEPLAPEMDDFDEADRGNLPNPFDLAHSMFSYVQEAVPSMLAMPSPASLTPPDPHSLDSYFDQYAIPTSQVTRPLHLKQGLQHVHKKARVKTANTLLKTIETAIGLWLALIWITIGRLVGYQ